jgi:hypothetical protein
VNNVRVFTPSFRVVMLETRALLRSSSTSDCGSRLHEWGTLIRKSQISLHSKSLLTLKTSSAPRGKQLRADQQRREKAKHHASNLLRQETAEASSATFSCVATAKPFATACGHWEIDGRSEPLCRAGAPLLLPLTRFSSLTIMATVVAKTYCNVG